MLRCPIGSVLGHVDSGKTSILDAIRETKVGQREAGGITQQIGASEIPLNVIMDKCSVFVAKMGIRFTIPGLLVIDTPGHEVFTNLRKRGGSIADIAILVIDVNKGIEPQTIEAMEILREYKTPFLIALIIRIDMNGVVMKQQQLYLLGTGKAYILTGTSLESEFENANSNFNELFNSFKAK